MHCTLVEDQPRCPPSEPTDAVGAPPFETAAVVEARCRALFASTVKWLKTQAADDDCLFAVVEPAAVERVFELGRMLLLLFLTCADQRVAAGLSSNVREWDWTYDPGSRKPRRLGTFFGKIWFWRSYMEPRRRHRRRRYRGYFPVERKLGLTRDGFSMLVIKLGLRLAVELPFEKTATTLKLFWGWSPSPRTLEELVLGAGSYARRFQMDAPPPEGDGDVLVIQVDSKGAPMATEAELRKRRRERKPNHHPESKRHRGRAKRKALGPKKRRAPGDHSKNAKMATLVVMYTLRREIGPDGRPKLIGPLNQRIYASFLPKRYAFEVARREAIKRGFGPESGKRIQFVNDGDEDLDTYRKQYFADYEPSRLLTTIDLPHVLEYVWGAAGALFKEGSGKLSRWVGQQKKRLLDSRADLVLSEAQAALAAIPETGPGNKGRRESLAKLIRYIESNRDRIDYRYVIEQDLELASGAVEGAAKHVIGHRFDRGGMRWIRERADLLLQLRCIALNGQWDEFFAWLSGKTNPPNGGRIRIRRRHPAPLPQVLRPDFAKAA